jgi:hypothetical protein
VLADAGEVLDTGVLDPEADALGIYLASFRGAGPQLTSKKHNIRSTVK